MQFEQSGASIKMKRLNSSILFLVVFSGFLFAEQPQKKTVWTMEPKDYRGVPFGATEEEVTKVMMGLTCYDFENHRNCAGFHKIGEVQVQNLISFSLDGKFSAVILNFKSEDFDFLKSVLIEKYGEPSKVERSPLKNRMGATFEQEHLFWQGKTMRVQALKYTDTISNGVAGIGLNSFFEKDNTFKKDKAKKAADDF